MDHNEFDFIDDLVHPFFNFLTQLGISLEPEDSKSHFKYPENLYIPPQCQLDLESKPAE